MELTDIIMGIGVAILGYVVKSQYVRDKTSRVQQIVLDAVASGVQKLYYDRVQGLKKQGKIDNHAARELRTQAWRLAQQFASEKGVVLNEEVLFSLRDLFIERALVQAKGAGLGGGPVAASRTVLMPPHVDPRMAQDMTADEEGGGDE